MAARRAAFGALRAAPAVFQTQTPAPPVTPSMPDAGLPLSPLAEPAPLPPIPSLVSGQLFATLREMHRRTPPYGAPPLELRTAAA